MVTNVVDNRLFQQPVRRRGRTERDCAQRAAEGGYAAPASSCSERLEGERPPGRPLSPIAVPLKSPSRLDRVERPPRRTLGDLCEPFLCAPLRQRLFSNRPDRELSGPRCERSE